MFTESLLSAGSFWLNAASNAGNGPRIVFFHGLGRRWQDFSPLFSSLSTQWSLTAIDHRGHGKSDRAMSYLVTDYVADGIALVKSIGTEPVILLGHSLGGLVSLGIAANAPELVRAAILIDPPSAPFLARLEQTNYATTWQFMRQLAGSLQDIGAMTRQLADLQLPSGERFGDLRDPAALRFMAGCLKNLDRNAMTPPLEQCWLKGYDVLSEACMVRCPVMVLAADEAVGGMLPAADATALIGALKDGIGITLKGIAHLAHWQQPELVLKHLHGFLHSI